MSDEEQGQLFGLPELQLEQPGARYAPGRAEVSLHHSLAAGITDGTVVDVDAALAAAALIAARAFDKIDRMDKPAYAAAALLTPYRETLHALRLPAAIDPTPAKLPATGPAAGARPAWLDDAFGTAE